jgi:thioredoxin 1
MAEIIALTDANFETEVMNSGIPVMVDFSAAWCGPCQALHPIIEGVAAEYDGKVKIGSIDIDQNRETPGKYQIMAVPTLIFFRDGTPVDKFTGLLGRNELKKKLDALIEG